MPAAGSVRVGVFAATAPSLLPLLHFRLAEKRRHRRVIVRWWSKPSGHYANRLEVHRHSCGRHHFGVIWFRPLSRWLDTQAGLVHVHWALSPQMPPPRHSMTSVRAPHRSLAFVCCQVTLRASKSDTPGPPRLQVHARFSCGSPSQLGVARLSHQSHRHFSSISSSGGSSGPSQSACSASLSESRGRRQTGVVSSPCPCALRCPVLCYESCHQWRKSCSVSMGRLQ